MLLSDDFVGMSDSMENLQQLIDVVHKFCNQWRLKANVIFKASQPREWASGSRAYERHEMQGVIIKCTRHECSVCEPKATPAPYP